MSDILERLKEDGPWDGLPRGEAIAEIERLRAALQDAKDLASSDAPAHMIVDVCERALAPCAARRG